MNTQTNGYDVDALVIGATGFAGGALAESLAKTGLRVRALARPTSDASKLESWGVEVIRGDLVSAEDVDRAVAGAKTLYNLASPFRDATAGFKGNHDVHVTGLSNLINAARKHGPARVVHTTTAGVHGHCIEIPTNEDSPFNPGDDYQVTKLEGEKMFRAAVAEGLPGVVIRPTSMWGPGDLRMLKMFKLIQTGKWRMVGDGQTWNHPCYRDDLTQGFRLAGEHPDAVGGVFIITGPNPVRLNDYANLVAEAVGVPHPTKRVPLMPVMAASYVCEALCKPFGIDPPLHPRRVHFFTNDRYFDYGKAKSTLGYEPRVTVAQGVVGTAEWYFDQGLLEGPKPEWSAQQRAALEHCHAVHESMITP